MIRLFFIILLLIPFLVNAADVKITELPEDTSPTSDDLIMTVNSPASSPTNKKVTLGNLLLWMATQDWTVTGTWNMTGATIGSIYLKGDGSTTKGVWRLYDLDNSAYVGLTPADATTSYTLILPGAAPSAEGLPITCNNSDSTCSFATGFSSITIGGFTASRNVEADGSGNLTSSDTATTGTGAPVKATSPTLTTSATINGIAAITPQTINVTTEGNLAITSSIVLIGGDNDGDHDTVDLQNGTYTGQIVIFVGIAAIDDSDTIIFSYTDTTCTGCAAVTFDDVGDTAAYLWTGTTWALLWHKAVD